MKEDDGKIPYGSAIDFSAENDFYWENFFTTCYPKNKQTKKEKSVVDNIHLR